MRRGCLRLLGWAAFLGVMVTVVPAQGYILPPGFILRMAMDVRQNLRIKDLTVQLTREGEGGELLEDRLYLKDPERLRWERSEGERTHVTILREGKGASGYDGALRLAKALHSDLLPVLLMPRGEDYDQREARMLEALKAAGVDTATVSLARHDEGPAYVIGAKPWETDKPQVWILKDEFIPLKYQVIDDTAGKPERVETRLVDFGSPVAGEWFPRVIEVYRNGALSLRAEVSKIATNQKLPDTLFDLPAK